MPGTAAGRKIFNSRMVFRPPLRGGLLRTFLPEMAMFGFRIMLPCDALNPQLLKVLLSTRMLTS